eukprot:9816829-Heterocapsa_arctica.AAC.1
MEVQAEGYLREPTSLPSASSGQVHAPLPVFNALPCVDRPRPLADHQGDERWRDLPRRANCRRSEHPAESVLEVRAGDDNVHGILAALLLHIDLLLIMHSIMPLIMPLIIMPPIMPHMMVLIIMPLIRLGLPLAQKSKQLAHLTLVDSISHHRCPGFAPFVEISRPSS